jgi:hypothetical protein
MPKFWPWKKEPAVVQSKEVDFAWIVNDPMFMDMVREAFPWAEQQLAFDDIGWGSTGKQKGEITAAKRRELVQSSRGYENFDPLAKQAIRLWTDYALGGEGMSVKSEQGQDVIDKFLKSKKNARITSSKGQQRCSKKLLVDGEIFFYILQTKDSWVIRTIDPLQMEPISDPDDEETTVCYERTTATDQKLYYKDWAIDDADLKEYENLKAPSGKTVSLDSLEDGVIYHLSFDEIDKRGRGLLFPVVDWTKQHRLFMQARVAIVQALARYAAKFTVKGGQATVDKIKRQEQSSLAVTGAANRETNPVNAPGGSWAANAGIDMQPTSRVTGGGDAQLDGNQLKLQVCAGSGIMLHYFGDPSTGNLATASTMELPMFKQFGGYQKLWKDAWSDIFSIIAESEDAQFDIDLPAILKDELASLGSAIAGIAGVFPEVKVPEVLQTILRALNVDDLGEVMKTIQAKRDEIDANVKSGLNADGSKPIPVAAPLPAKQQKALEGLVDQLEKLSEVLK